jgi:hypothetical protein
VVVVVLVVVVVDVVDVVVGEVVACPPRVLATL